jgi:hypothetical protein
MTAYTLVPRQDRAGYDIRVVDADGAHHTMLGFKTEADAWTWIVHDKEMDEARPRTEDAEGWIYEEAGSGKNPDSDMIGRSAPTDTRLALLQFRQQGR